MDYVVHMMLITYMPIIITEHQVNVLLNIFRLFNYTSTVLFRIPVNTLLLNSWYSQL